MKNKVQKALAISGLAIAIGTSGLTLPASANTLKHAQKTRSEKIIKTKKVERYAKTATMRRIVPGTVKTISENSIEITNGSKTYTVTTDASTRILNKLWKTIDLSTIQTGNKVRVLGSISGSTISAKTIRDISL